MIRELEIEDLKNGFFETLSALSPLALTVDENQALVLFKERKSNNIKTFVYLEDDKVVGTLSMFIERKFSGGNCCHIEDLAVRPEYRSKGIGQKLMEHVKDLAKDCYKLTLPCINERVSFHEKCGFKKLQNTMIVYNK